MQLSALAPQWVRLYESERPALSETTIDTAQGIMFLCPHCFARQGGGVGAHVLICWFCNREVPDARKPDGMRYAPSGTGFDDLTLVAIGDPANDDGACRCVVVNGEVW